jgi:hypothetical protein
MNRSRFAARAPALVGALSLVSALAVVGCSDDKSPFHYSDPETGALRLIKKSADGKSITFDFVVGDTALTGYSTGFTLPVDATRVELGTFTPGTALPAGTAPVAAKATIPTLGPLTGMLVTAQSQKAAGEGAAEADAVLAPGTVLFTVQLTLVDGATSGDVFDGTAEGFVLPSGGLRNKLGITVVDKGQVAVGKLTVAK